MTTFKVRPVEGTTTFKNTLLSDKRLSADAIGFLCFTIGLAGAVHDLDVAHILNEWNDGRGKETFIGKDKFRRFVNEWKKAGYVRVSTGFDETTGEVTDKIVELLHESTDPIVKSATVRDTTPVKNTHKFPAAQIFQETFTVDLDLDSVRHIQKEISDLKAWGRVCADHYASLTQQQKDSLSYRTKGLKFCLDDYRVNTEREKRRAEKTSRPQPVEEEPPKKKTFSDYVDSGGYGFGSEAYTRFRDNWLQKADEKGNTEAIEQVEEYEGLQRSLAEVKARKGGVKG